MQKFSDGGGRMGEGGSKGGAGDGGAETEVALYERVEGGGVVLVELAVFVDQDRALQGLLGVGVVADGVVPEIVDYFEGEEEAGLRDGLGPVEDGGVDEFDVFEMVWVGSCGGEGGFLE